MRQRAPPLAKRLRGKSVCICAGPGGVGKTTTAAALALGLARKGQRVAVVTIDPARRLASALGIDELDNEPRRIDPALLAAQGIECKGELWATMLDSKRTFDALIGRIAPDERARDEVLANRIYQEISGAVAGTQEFSAIAKLYELHREGRFDTIVLDTPPARNALDFLDAPMRMTRFLEGRSVRMFLAPGNLAARLVGRGSGLVLSMFSRFTGVDLIGELSGFFGALAGMLDGFRERARVVDQLLRDPATAFLLVTSPEPEPAREAIFFAEQLRAAGMARVALIVNRVHRDGLEGHTARRGAGAARRRAGRAPRRARGGQPRRLRRARAARPCDGRAARSGAGGSRPDPRAPPRRGRAGSRRSRLRRSAPLRLIWRRGDACA